MHEFPFHLGSQREAEPVIAQKQSIYVANNKKNQVEIIYCLLYLSGRRKTILLLVALSRPDEGICLYM